MKGKEQLIFLSGYYCGLQIRFWLSVLKGILFLEYASDMKLQRAMKKREKTVKKLMKMQK